MGMKVYMYMRGVCVMCRKSSKSKYFQGVRSAMSKRKSKSVNAAVECVSRACVVR